MPVQAKGQVRPEKSAYHSIALLAKFSKKDISLLLPRACSTMDKIVDRYAITIYPYLLGDCPPETFESQLRNIVYFRLSGEPG